MAIREEVICDICEEPFKSGIRFQEGVVLLPHLDAHGFVKKHRLVVGDYCSDCFKKLLIDRKQEAKDHDDDAARRGVCSRCQESLTNCGSYHSCPDDIGYHNRR